MQGSVPRWSYGVISGSLWGPVHASTLLKPCCPFPGSYLKNLQHPTRVSVKNYDLIFKLQNLTLHKAMSLSLLLLQKN